MPSVQPMTGCASASTATLTTSRAGRCRKRDTVTQPRLRPCTGPRQFEIEEGGRNQDVETRWSRGEERLKFHVLGDAKRNVWHKEHVKDAPAKCKKKKHSQKTRPGLLYLRTALTETLLQLLITSKIAVAPRRGTATLQRGPFLGEHIQAAVRGGRPEGQWTAGV